jgi:hypothetical protein
MADLKISQLTSATLPLAGTEVLPIVQSSSTKKVATDDLTVKNVRSNATTGILQVAGPGASTTRVMTTPDANFTAARTDAAQSFTGDQTLSTGNLVIGTSGKGIDFSATPGTGTSELLADYEEGTWTPTDASGAGLTLTVNGTQFYTRVGRVITVSFNISYPATASVSAAIIGSLPFNSVAANQGGIIIGPSSTTVAFVNGSLNQFSIVTPANVAVTNATLSGQNIFGSLTYAVV